MFSTPQCRSNRAPQEDVALQAPTISKSLLSSLLTHKRMSHTEEKSLKLDKDSDIENSFIEGPTLGLLFRATYPFIKSNLTSMRPQFGK